MLRKAIVIVSIGLSLSACGDSNQGDAPESKSTQQSKIVEKKTDPKRCVKRAGGICKKWDDKDYIFVTEDRKEHDVDMYEYNSKNVGDLWPE